MSRWCRGFIAGQLAMGICCFVDTLVRPDPLSILVAVAAMYVATLAGWCAVYIRRHRYHRY